MVLPFTEIGKASFVQSGEIGSMRPTWNRPPPSISGRDIVTVLGGGVLLGMVATFAIPVSGALPPRDRGVSVASSTAYFSMCHDGGGTNCVVDGDTIWMDGEKVRLADIDAPETHEPRCGSEAELGERATRRLQQFVNSDPVSLETSGFRDRDRYGRKLRIVTVGGQSAGEQLVAEGLARRWVGRRQPWCA